MNCFDNESLIYTLDGDLEPFSFIEYDIPIVRKMLDINNDNSDKNEYNIAKILINNPHDNIVTILYVCDEYIDIEKVNIEYNDNNININDIKNGLLHLHSLNIIYIDIKLDNIGYCNNNNKYKIFDFNCSGISNNDKTEWLFNCEPCDSFNLKKIDNYTLFKNNNIPLYTKIILKVISNKKKLIKYDDFIFYELFNKYIY
jgi:serine/threonine protein kinase